MLFSRSLSITWGEDKRFWHWPSIKLESSTSDDVVVEVAELLNVCWLEVYGKLDISYLSPGVKYEVVFLLMLKDHSYGWDVPVNLRLVFPNGATQHQHKVNLQTRPRSQWVELHVGEFQTPPNKQEKAEIQFSMFEYEGGQWKRGLVIKGVIIQPKK
ncbi:Phloem protein 2-like [Macleaya cordata]|uniref:Phloem protein 2-like n=1 Tax=Macleaya cordata TaxID=56857 RepID=A0A200QMV7_MACCD|nr:Phloem protein 2-like [Macleaya cordata]